MTAQQPLGPAAELNSHILEKEAALGRQLAADFHQRTTPVDSPAVENYLDRLGQRIVAQVPDAKFGFRFSVIADDPCPTIHEPVALPGGYVFVPSALVLAVQDEAELAGMLAHAIQHITQRRATRQVTRGTVMKNSTIPLIFMGGWAGSCGGRLAIPRGFLARQRSDDLEADVLAVQTMAKAGFDPQALVRYIERVQPPASVTKDFAALPDRDRRVAGMRSVIETLRNVNYVTPTEEVAAVQQELRRLRERSAEPKVPPTLKRRDSK